jgi:hypothetical protein
VNFAELNKEQKQKLVLAVLVGLTAVYAVFRFGLTPLLSGGGDDAGADVDALRSKVERAERLVRQRTTLRERCRQSTDEMKSVLAEQIPGLDNPLSWVTERVYRSGRKVGVDIESVNESGGASAPWKADGKKRSFVPYSVRITTSCSFFELVDLIEDIEAGNPYLVVTGVSVKAQASRPLVHRAYIQVDWPAWADPEAARALAEKLEEVPS